jgi:hypothetical protein
MSLSYSSNLQLTLIGTGDQEGVWGETTNTNLGTLLEQAISGYTTFSVNMNSTPTPLSILNGVSSTGRNMYIELTGDLNAEGIVEIPTNEKLYFFYNNTTADSPSTSTYPVTVRVSGQTGVSIPNGARMLVVCDGSDAVNAITSLATNNLQIEANQDGSTSIKVINSDSGTSAEAVFVAQNGTNSASFGITGIDRSPNGVLLPSDAFIFSDADIEDTGVSIVAAGASGVIKFAAGSTTEVVRIDSSNVQLTNNHNFSTAFKVVNTNAENGATADFVAQNGTYTATFGINGTNKTTNGALAASDTYIYNNAPGPDTGISIVAAGTDAVIKFAAGGTSEVARITSTGLDVIGNITATGNITAYYSDDRLKTRKGNIENALDKVLSLDGFHYEANEIAQALGYKAKPEVGLSAQQVQAVLPEVVVPAPIDGQYLTVHYERIIPLLVEAIKEQSKKIEALEAKLNGME